MIRKAWAGNFIFVAASLAAMRAASGARRRLAGHARAWEPGTARWNDSIPVRPAHRLPSCRDSLKEAATQPTAVGSFLAPLAILPALAAIMLPARLEAQAHLGVGFDTTARIISIIPRSPADQAGLALSDRITAVNGRGVRTPAEVSAFFAKAKPGDTVRLSIAREGGARQIDVVAGVRPEPVKKKAADLAAPADGFVPIAPYDVIMGDFRQSEPGQVETGRRCFTLMTEPGVRYTINTMQEGLDHVYLDPRVSPEARCDAPFAFPAGTSTGNRRTEDGHWDVPARYYSSLSFNAGGGPYTVSIETGGQPFKDYMIGITMAGRVAGARAPSQAAIAFAAASAIESASSVTPRAPVQPDGGQVLRDCADVCPEMVVVPAGGFLMGSNSSEADRRPNEGPQHRVAIRNPFAIGKYEVTGAEWDACVANGGCAGVATNLGRRPAPASWVGARSYAEWLSRKTGQRYSLPSEAEWEYAARAGTGTPWNTGEAIITDDANILDQFRQAVPVGGFPPNAFGLHDMHGNIAEWTLDCLDVGYFGSPADGAAAVTPNCPQRVVRGGGWADMPGDVRSARRAGAAPSDESPGIGFRVARAM